MAKQWDKNAPYEKNTETNWSERILGLVSADDDSTEPQTRTGPERKRDSEGQIKVKKEESGEKEEPTLGDLDRVVESIWLLEREDIIPGKDVFLLNPCFTPEECKKLIAAAEEVGYGRTDYPKQYRGNYRLITTDNNLAKVLWSRIRTRIPPQVDEDGHVWDAVGLNECFRLSKYCDGDVFQSHVDTCFQRNCEEKSMYTVNIYLNGTDEFRRGHTRFYREDRLAPECSVEPVAGLGLLFRQPPHSAYDHDGDVVCDGFKYLIRSDVMYHKQKK